jgi:alpha-tubulin suppressor-like RCC1 family protein
MGENALVGSSTPTQVPDAADIVQVSATLEGGMMLDANGTVWGFGDGENRFCELGGETYIGNVGVLGPVTIPGLGDNIVAVSSGTYHSVALDADGVAWVWGGQRFGCTPFAALDDVTAVEAGDNNVVLFVRGDGSAWGMGYNFYGQLGNGTTLSNYSTPTPVAGVSNVVGLAAGQYHSLFLQADGTLWAAGWNHDCQLGFAPASGDKSTTPGQVGLSGVTSVTGGNTHSIAITGDNALWVWGLNSAGQLTGGTNGNLSSPVCTPAQINFP